MHGLVGEKNAGFRGAETRKGLLGRNAHGGPAGSDSGFQWAGRHASVAIIDHHACSQSSAGETRPRGIRGSNRIWADALRQPETTMADAAHTGCLLFIEGRQSRSWRERQGRRKAPRSRGLPAAISPRSTMTVACRTRREPPGARCRCRASGCCHRPNQLLSRLLSLPFANAFPASSALRYHRLACSRS